MNLQLFILKILNKKTLEDFVSAIDAKIGEIRKFFNQPAINIPIFIFPNQQSLHSFVIGSKGEDWLVGFGGAGSVKIIDPDMATNYNKTYQGILKCVVHEIVHIFTNLGYRKKSIVMSEGIAEYFAEQHNQGAIEAAAKNIYEIANDLFNAKSSVELGHVNYGYDLAYTVADYMLKKYDETKVQEYFASRDFEPFELLNIERNDFISNWANFVVKNYSF
jgi:hypothetical protein